ncbi:hypothetical protein HMPREF9715_01348 [Myroides odoratimimus CIP 101113]|uniref:Uncharacterized protein n=2 Tax=Myroides odoratimimus TaxID=76832 RepID=A0AAV3F4C8_9FLAO|nr:hypothetical protein HMPREF9715_01348 [Myroides odoratimimus CIP 101113]
MLSECYVFSQECFDTFKLINFKVTNTTTMNEFLRYRFLIDSGVDVLFKHEINGLRHTYNFSDDYFRFLLVSSHTALMRTVASVSFFTFTTTDHVLSIQEMNEDSIFSSYIFIIGRWDEHTLIGELLIGVHKGAIVLLDENQYCDIDSVEELLEDTDLDIEYILQDDIQTLTALLSEEVGVISVLDYSFVEFFENRLVGLTELRC